MLRVLRVFPTLYTHNFYFIILSYLWDKFLIASRNNNFANQQQVRTLSLRDSGLLMAH